MDRLSAFEGRWTLSREIEDRRAGTRLVFAGQAIFTRDAHGLQYDESGTWERGELAGYTAIQRHLWRAVEGGVEVFYQDGRPFHRFDWPGGTGLAAAGHDCAPDRYDAVYRFALPDAWAVDWTAKGPAKDYTSRTRFDREQSSGA